ncbi:MAG TPA: hypothetical protein VJZ91_08890, partial [Blastocatellia bacterium]|nr:hypothetical protein [Blastocatellia bacterium]
MAANPRVRTSNVFESTGTDYLEPFIESTISAAARFRRVLLVIIITSVLAFGAFWNARLGSWINARLETARSAQHYWDLKERLLQIPAELNAVNQSLSQTPAGNEAYKLAEQKRSLEGERERVQQEMDHTDPGAVQWLQRKGLQSKDAIAAEVGRLEDQKARHRSIPIPFFGIDLDINDLGLLGGFTFV